MYYCTLPRKTVQENPIICQTNVIKKFQPKYSWGLTTRDAAGQHFKA